MEFIDTHTHTYDEAFAGCEDEVIARALAAGVSVQLQADVDSRERDRMFALVERHPGVLRPMLGLYPGSVRKGWQAEIDELERWRGCGIVAIGEIGLDYHYGAEWKAVKVLGQEDKTGSVTAIGAVSPQGGDLSEPVSQATLRIVKVFWGLSSALAYKRHFPAIDWLISYSLYSDKLADWYNENVSADFSRLRTFAMSILQEESELEEIVRLVGSDALSFKDRLTMETAKSIREDYLHQNAFHEVDTFTSLDKQYKILKMIYDFHRLALDAINKDAELKEILELPSREKIGRAKYVPESEIASLDEADRQIIAELKTIAEGDDNG